MKILPEAARKPLLLLLAVIVIVQFYSYALTPVFDDVPKTVAVLVLSGLTWIVVFRFLPLDTDESENGPW